MKPTKVTTILFKLKATLKLKTNIKAGPSRENFIIN
jgi:hypothetical protein